MMIKACFKIFFNYLSNYTIMFYGTVTEIKLRGHETSPNIRTKFVC